MHFHLPKSLRGWRDFGREVTIVVIGVLIAIGLEQAVDYHHWSQKIDRAHGAMRVELSGDDGPQAYVRLAIAPCLDAAAGELYAAANAAPVARLRRLAMNYSPPFRTWDAEGWQAVIASDVGSHMQSDKLVTWSEPYLLIGNMTEWNERESDLVTDMHESLPQSRDASPNQLQDFKRDVAQLRSLNIRLAAGARLLLAAMDENQIQIAREKRAKLLREATARYGACVRDPAVQAPLEFTQFTTEEDMRRFALGDR